MPTAIFAAAHIAPAAAHPRRDHGVARAAVWRRPARALSTKRSGRLSVQSRAWWKFGGGADAAEDTKKNDAPGASSPSPSGTSAKKTIETLSALLGEPDVDEEERRREEEALVAREAALSRLEAVKAEQRKRLQSYLSVSTETLRTQQLQMLFLDMPILPRQMRGAFLREGRTQETGASASSSSDDVSSPLEPYDEWFDVQLPLAAASASAADPVVSGSSKDSTKERAVLMFGEDVTPAYVKYEGERQAGEFSIPIVPYPRVCLPGSVVRLNLFEPRWLTLFAKLLLREKPSATSQPEGLVLEGARENHRIDLNRNPLVRAYEAEADETTIDVVPGRGRMDEAPFEATGRFGALYRRADGKVAGVGSVMEIVAHDVVVNGQVLSVYAKGVSRFRVLRVRQCNPYLVVDAVPAGNDAALEAAAKKTDSPRRLPEPLANNIVAGFGSTDALDAVSGVDTPASCVASESSREAPVAGSGSQSTNPSASARGLARVVERVIAADPYYSDAVGLGEAWKNTSLKTVVENMNDFEVADALLYAQPELALGLLACDDFQKRKAFTENAALGMEAAVAAGITPRKARLFKSLGAFASLFLLGFGIACVRDIVETNWPR